MTSVIPFAPTWGAKHDWQINVFVESNNEQCYCKQSLPWTRGLTNYLDDNWLCNLNIVPNFDYPTLFAHLFRGGRPMTTSVSCLIIQKVFSKT
jgi:hypothetical protein